jgi:hypothetical protein
VEDDDGVVGYDEEALALVVAGDMEARSAQVSASVSKAVAGKSQEEGPEWQWPEAGSWAQLMGSRPAQRFAMVGAEQWADDVLLPLLEWGR